MEFMSIAAMTKGAITWDEFLKLPRLERAVFRHEAKRLDEMMRKK